MQGAAGSMLVAPSRPFEGNGHLLGMGRAWYSWANLSPAAVSAALTLLLLIACVPPTPVPSSLVVEEVTGGKLDGQADTLAIYVFSNTDLDYLDNLHFFLREAVKPNDGCEYIIAVNQDGKKDSRVISDLRLPELPPSARYVLHKNQCYDWGTFGWVLRKHVDDISRFKYFFFINSSVRGPFLPAYAPEGVHFTHYYKGQINDDVKLVGPTINCEGVHVMEDGESKEYIANPHVQSYAVMTDWEGLRVLRQDGRVFKCYSAFEDTIRYSELGSSLAILNAGYNIASFMPMYEGIDWRKRGNSTWECGSMMNPTNAAQYADRSTLAPTTMMFVKVKTGRSSALEPPTTHGWVKSAALTVESWKAAAQKGEHDLSIDRTSQTFADLKMQRVLEQARHGIECFDSQFYIANNPDLMLSVHARGLHHPFVHYINIGQFEFRQARFRCTVPLDAAFPLEMDYMNDRVLWYHTGFKPQPMS